MRAASHTAETPVVATAESISAQRAKKARAKARRLAKPFPQLAAAVEAWVVLNIEEVRLGDLHNHADEFGTDAEEALAFKRWERARKRADKAAEAIMNLNVADPAAMAAKIKIYRATQAMDGAPCAASCHEPEYQFMLACVMEDLATLKAPPPTSAPPSGGGDFGLVSLAAQHAALAAELEGVDQSTREGQARAEHITGAFQPIIDRANELVATTVDGFRAKAAIADYWAPGPDFVEHEELPWQVHASLVRDLLGAPTAPQVTTPLSAAIAAYEAAKAEDARLLQVTTELDAQVEALAPTPEILRAPGGGTYRTVEAILNSRETLGRRDAMIEALEEWLPRRLVISAELGEDHAQEAWESFSCHREFQAVVDTPASSLAELVAKARIYVDNVWCALKVDNVDEAATLARLLADPDVEGGWAPIRIYQDILRLTGGRPDLADVQPAAEEDEPAELEAAA